MFGYRIHSWGSDPVWEEIPDPSPGPGEVLVDVESCSVGLTVLNYIRASLSDGKAGLPRVPGHELVGTVLAVGTGGDASMVGRRIGGYFYLVCGNCPACVAGRDAQCANLAGRLGVHSDGGYAPMVVIPQHNAIPLPDGLDAVSASVVPDAVATPVHVAARADIGAGDRVAVFGAGGGVGIHMIQVAKHHGAQVVGFDVVDEKLSAIDDLGVVPVESSDLTSIDPQGLFGDGRPTVVVDLLGTQASLRWSIDGLDMGGRLVSLTAFQNRPIEIQSREFVFRELSFLGSRYCSRAELFEAGQLVASGAVKPIIGHIGGPAEVPEMHDKLLAGTLLGRGALDWSLA